MSRTSDAYNALPIERRRMLHLLMMESELRLIAVEQKRIMADARRAVREMGERAKRIRKDMDRCALEISSKPLA